MAVPLTADIFQAKSESLAGLLPDIHEHKAALPNFQREWVWEPAMVKDLIVSVANRYPAGSLLTMPNTRDTFALRPFSGAGTELRNTPTLMILDGQQRLTSLYQALYSKSGVKAADGTVHYLYLDVKRLTEHDTETAQQEATFEECVFSVQVNKQGERLRYRGLREYVDITTREQEIEQGALPLYTVFNQDVFSEWREQYIEFRAEDDFQRFRELRKEWDAEVAPWIVRIRDYRFPVIELNRDMELHAICHIFEKVNSTGVPLTVFELCTAILWSQGLHLNDKWDKTSRKLKGDQTLRMQGPLEGAMFLQAISLLDSLRSKRSHPDERVAVNCRREDLLKLKAPTVREWWDVATVAYRDASKFMESQGILAQRILPYSTLLLPLAAIMGYLKSEGKYALFGQAWPKIERWYWCSVFAQRYSSSVEAAAAKDFEEVVSWIEGGPEPEAVRNFSFAADRLQNQTSIRSALYKGVLCLLAKNGARDFGGEGTLSVNLYYDSQQDHHHIFPVKALENLGVTDWRKDSIVNKTLIGAALNRSIGGRLPSAYLANLNTRLMSEERLTSILRSHLISPETLESDDWETFFLSRREELKDLISAACGAPIQDFSDGKSDSLPMQMQRLVSDVSEIELRIRALIDFHVSDWKLLPENERSRADELIEREIRSNPGGDRSGFTTVNGRLAFCDLRSLEQIITNKSLWPRFSDTFGTKEGLAGRFRQLAPLRNANAHLRAMDDVGRMDAKAAVLWFNDALARAERDRSALVDFPRVDDEIEDSGSAPFDEQAIE